MVLGFELRASHLLRQVLYHLSHSASLLFPTIDKVFLTFFFFFFAMKKEYPWDWKPVVDELVVGKEL
jgi:hypothetical protein